MENTAKKHGKILSFSPLAAYALWTICFLVVTGGHIETSGVWNHFQWLSEILSNYNLLLITYALCAVWTFAVLLYFIIHIARIKHMGAGDKIAWIMFLSVFLVLAFPVFYYMELRHEPMDIDVYPNIA
jgi:hypothetical protein